MILIYSSIMEVLRFVAVVPLSIIFKKKRWGLTQRQKLPRILKDYRQKNVIWVHAASLGEAKLLIKFLDYLSSKHPDDLYLITATTTTGVEYLEQNLKPSVCAFGYLPYDTIPLMKRIVEHFGISRLWLIETELWPCMLHVCKRAGVSLGVVNGRLEEKGYRNLKRFSFLFRDIFEQFDTVIVQDKEYALRFRSLGMQEKSIHVIGNLKSRVTVKRPEHKQWSSLREKMNLNEETFVITAGCVHPGEGTVLQLCLNKLQSEGFKCKMIVIPRHLKNAGLIAQEFENNCLHLKDPITWENWQTCVLEKYGILEDMYRVADAAVVGGSFVKVGGHNVWDAAQFGIPLFFGPHYYTQKKSCDKLIDSGVGFKAGDGVELANEIVRVIKRDACSFITAQLKFADEVNKEESVLESLIP
ncbi:glycosyltransferase N-terminal domain-containing protein [Chitinispirillales bacterium ANBcel5]|uniref:3-deoxy-D-manno-octulosonic acid transferase n=1 Tax=Cellulosispirillum alkaliphilum TaxID=3039283 RepID=UPI002A5539EC|nr:glycosyltransferase N-terminal domain-containing protein [Chitinispirillales bacterium ANBcel5]